MNRESLGPAVVAVVCILAVVVAAATLTSPVEQTGDSGVGSGGSDGVGSSDGGNVDLGGQNDSPAGFANLSNQQGQVAPIRVCVKQLQSPWVVLGAVAGLVAFGYVVKRRYDVASAVGVTTAVAMPMLFLWMLLTSCADRSGGGLPEMFTGRSSGGGASGDPVDPNAAVPPVDMPVWLVVVLGLAIVAILAVTLSDRDVLSAGLSPSLPTLRSENDGGEEQAPVFGGDTAAVGRAAGRAADRIEDSEDVRNEVYRAWVEMTRHLDVDHPESSTPEEFRGAAVEAGMDPEDVGELTWLFEEVRYGGRDADEERESRALSALRRIEETYAGDAT